MRSYSDQRLDRSSEILSQTGYPTEYFAGILGLQAEANQRCFELISITQVIASHVAMVAKHHLACLRPDKRGATVMPMLPTPAHGTFPSAHAAEAFAVATVLSGLVQTLDARPEPRRLYPLPKRVITLLYKQAERIAVNRTVAGVHFPIDSWAGAALGEAVGEIILAKCRGGKVGSREYNAEHCDFRIGDFNDPSPGAPSVTHGLTRIPGTVALSTSRLFAWLWSKTLDEFKP